MEGYSASCNELSNENKDSRKRAPNFSVQEKTLLLNIIYNFKHIIENKQTNAKTWREKDEAWEQVTKNFNSQTPGNYPRAKDALKKYYDNIKKYIRKEVANEKKEIKTTGGGKFYAKKDAVQELALSIMNEKTVFGLNNDFDGDRPLENVTESKSDMATISTSTETSTYMIPLDEDSNIFINDEHSYSQQNITQSNEGIMVQEPTATESVPPKERFTGHVSTPKTPCLKHTWTKRRRPKNQPHPTTEVIQENLELVKLKRECYDAEKINILAKRKQDEELFSLKKQKLLLEIDINKLELKKRYQEYKS